MSAAALDISTAVLALDSRCQLGEGILWCERRAALFWIDIDGCALWQHTPQTGSSRHWPLPLKPGCLALAEDGRLLLGLSDGLYVFDLQADDPASALTHLAAVESDNPDTRLNDGRADRAGNFVFGSKSERADQAAIGGYYQYSATHGVRRLALPAAAIPNSICFNVDGTRLYFCDSLQPRILCCDYQAASARVSEPRIFAEVDHPQASPDGSIIDAQDHLWNAQWGASRLLRYRPDGSIERIIQAPVSQPTCCALGGAALDRLYYTSARADLSPEILAGQADAGGVFVAAQTQWPGLPEARVRLP